MILLKRLVLHSTAAIMAYRDKIHRGQIGVSHNHHCGGILAAKRNRPNAEHERRPCRPLDAFVGHSESGGEQ